MPANTRPQGRQPKTETLYVTGDWPCAMDTKHGNIVLELEVANPGSEVHPKRKVYIVMDPQAAERIKKTLNAESWEQGEARGNHWDEAHPSRGMIGGVDDSSEGL